ncbi:hypothetical protein GCM10009616_32520 [Microlunatus lacustris]
MLGDAGRVSTALSDLVTPRLRVVVDNDFSGDPDGLVQLAHHALSPSVVLVGVIGSHLRTGDAWDDTGASAQHAADAARRVLVLAGRSDVPVVAGSEVALADGHSPRPSAGVDLILAEARREDTDLPLYLACGAGLTEVASAWLTDAVAVERTTLVWIGGAEHAGWAEPPPGAPEVEYNQAIDPLAVQLLFGDSAVPIWQVPRDAYRQTLASTAELVTRLAPHGELGRHLADAVLAVGRRAAAGGRLLGETYALGDSPLVLLTALQSAFQPDPSSSRSVWLPTPRLDDRGRYVERPDGRPLRVWTQLDTRLMLEDLYAKLQLAAG